MGNTLMKISVPLDKDCFIEMECDFCKNRFMLHQDVYESEDNINFFCPICGLPNKINTFFVPEVLEKAQQMAMNYMLEELETISFGSSKMTEELHSLQRITRMEFSPVLTIMESVVGSYIPNWKLRLLFMAVSFPKIFRTI